MRYLLVSIAGSTALFVLLAVGTQHHSGVGTLSEWFVSLFYYPSLFVACLTAFISLVALFSATKRLDSIVALLLSLPMIGYGFYLPEYPYDKRMFAEEKAKGIHSDNAYVLGQHLIWYYKLHPERFKYVGRDEEVQPDGFYDFVTHLKDSRGYGRNLHLQDHHFIDPWGRPYRYYLDRDHDSYIEGLGQRICLVDGEDEWGHPSGTYIIGVGIGSEHMGYPEPYSDTRFVPNPPWESQFEQP